MATQLADLPKPLADAVARARSQIAIPATRFPRREIDPTIAAWVLSVTETGALADAIAEVAASDRGLA